MKKSNLLVLFLALFTTVSYAQLVNQGGTITVQPGATLVVQSDLTNTTGTITNNGTIEVEGNFTNDATVTSASGSKLVFTGSSDSNFEGGTDTYTIVENDKTAGKVILTENLAVSESVDFSGGTSNIDLANFNITLSEATTTNGTQATGWFETSGTGKVVKELSAAATTNFDVGDATNYTPVSVNHTGTYGASAQISAKVTATAHPNIPSDADDYISRYWTVDNSDVTSPSMAMTGTYVAGDVTGTEGDVKGARYEAANWEFATGAQNASTVSATSTAATSDLTGTNFYGKADISFYLQAAYNSTNGNMDKTLNDLGLIPLTSPYDANITANAIPATAVDWIEIEVRDETNPETILSSTSAFLLQDGSVVGVDGSSLPLLKDALEETYLAVSHRNHLAIRTNAKLNLANPVATDLSDASNVFTDPAVVSNPAQKDLGGGVMGLWMGDAGSDNQVSYNGSGNDKVKVLIRVGFATPNDIVNGYYDEDIDMDGDVAYNGSGSDKLKVLITIGFATPNAVYNNHAQK